MGTRPTKTPPVRLSQREMEVARLVARGMTNREIAGALFISERTVDGHLEHVREKLAINSRAQVAAWVVRHDAEPTIPAQPAPTSPPPSRRWTLTHPRAWMATALVLAVLAAGVGVLRLTEPPPPIIETIAGTECATQIYPGGCFTSDGAQKAVSAGLSRPSDIAVDSSGRIYIADYNNRRVRRVDGQQNLTTVAGGGTVPLSQKVIAYATSAKFDWASGIAIDGQNNLLVLLSAGEDLEVWRVDQDGFMTLVKSLGVSSGAEPTELNLPLGGLALSRDGTLYIADRYGNRVYKLTRDGTLTAFAGTGEFGFCCDGSAAGGAELAWPVGLALDRSGNLYIADSGNNRIRKVDPRGTVTTFAGSDDLAGDSGDGALAVKARLSFPFGVAFAPDGSIVIADTGNHRLRRVTAGVIDALAGNGRSGFFGDRGPALQAELSGPEAVAFDARGDLFIADTENQRVREIPQVSPP
jgi:DNA-binding CsgD family transcriptional regulator/sugar lactone lactonase YvrE